MCQITELQLIGDQIDPSGAPSVLQVFARTTDCDYVDIEIFRTDTDLNALFAQTGIPAEAIPQSSQRLARANFTVMAQRTVQCGELLYVRARCATDPDNEACARNEFVMVQCKGVEAAECPTSGPPVSIEPPFAGEDCTPAGQYTLTIGGTFPAGTQFSWKIGDVATGQTSSTGNHTTTFVLNHTAGSGGKFVIAEVEVPGCEDQETVALVPPAEAIDCPTNVSLLVEDGQVSHSAIWTAGDGAIEIGDLAPGVYEVRITAPAGDEVWFEWYLDNVHVAGGLASNGFDRYSVDATAPQTEFSLAVRVLVPCCVPLLISLRLQTGVAATPTEEPADQPPAVPPLPTPPVTTPPTFCIIWRVVVAVVLAAALIANIASACLPLAGALLPMYVGIIAIAIAVAVLLLLICGPDLCRILGVIAWSLKWSIVIGTVIAIACFGITALVVVLIMGMILSAVIWLLVQNNCNVPPMISLP